MSLKLLAEQVAHRKGKLDDYLYKKDVTETILSIYAMLVRQDYTRTGKLTASSIQTLKCVELEEASKFECCGPTGSTCKILRSKLEIPQLIDIKSPTPFDYVGAIDFSNPFGHVSVSQIPYINLVRFKSLDARLQIKYSFSNRRIYILNYPSIEAIAVTGAFARPHELSLCCDCDGLCYDAEGEFQLPAHLEYDIKRLVYQEFQLEMEERDADLQIPVEKKK